MKIKPTEIPFHIYQEWPLTKKTTNNVLAKMWRGNPHAMLMWLYTGIATKENSIKVLQKIKNRTATWSSNFISVFTWGKQKH